MNRIGRRDLFKLFGVAGLMTVPVLRQTRAFAQDNFSPIYCQVFKPLGSMDVGGTNMYYPNGDGESFDFNGKNTESLNAVRDYLIVPRNLSLFKAGHGSGQQTLFTNTAPGRDLGTKPNFASNAPTEGPSLDHLIAEHLYARNQSHLKHFHFSASPSTDKFTTGQTVSYPGNHQVLQPTTDLHVMYRRIVDPVLQLCGGAQQAPLSADELRRRSVLDFHLSRIASVKRALGLSASEIAKLDGYAEQLREMERQIAGVEGGRSGACPSSLPSFDELEADSQQQNERQMRKRVRAMFDLTALAIEWELTNAASLMIGHGGDRTRYADVSPDSNIFHGMSHKTANPGPFNIVAKFMWDEIANFLATLRDRKTLAGQSLLDAHCVLIAGGEVSRPDDHSRHNFPLMIAGRAGGALRTGYTFNVPSTNGQNAHGRMLLSVCHAMGLTHLSHVGLESESQGGSLLPIHG